MILIIDAYNLIKQVLKKPQVQQHEIQAFIRQLKKYATAKSLKIVLVFDGGDAAFVYKTRDYPIELVYSGYNLSADDVIKELLSESHHNQVILISSDNELQRYAKNLAIEFLTSLSFYGLVKNNIHKSVAPSGGVADTRLHKMTESHELDALMNAYTQHMPQKKDDMPAALVPIKTYTDSKTEKKRNKLLKKL